MKPDSPKGTVRGVPPQTLTVRAWHHCPPDVSLLSVLDPPPAEGRYHRKDGPAAWYGSSHERGAWAEYFRHLIDTVDPFHQRRQIGRALATEIRVLNLTDPEVRKTLELKEADLRSNDLTEGQQLADEARDAGFDGILAPSAAMKGEQTLVVFRSAMKKVSEEHSRVQHPPVNMLDKLARMFLPKYVSKTLRKLRVMYRRR